MVVLVRADAFLRVTIAGARRGVRASRTPLNREEKKERRGPPVPHRNSKTLRVLWGRVLAFGCGPHHPLVRLIFPLRRFPPSPRREARFQKRGVRSTPSSDPSPEFRHQTGHVGTTTKD